MAEQVCREVPARAQRGLTPLPVSVNFSAQDFEYIDIPTALNEIYERYHLEETDNGKLLIVEITEQDMATASEKFYEQLRRLRKNGFHVWIDDFGSGYSSLNVFSRFDVDLIKFDMAFMKRLDEGEAGKIILTELMKMATSLGVNTICEGVETIEQAHFLREIGCSKLQGYYFMKPAPLEQIMVHYVSARR
jgi:EAL domain-containing protein (putative c-di-GMP-specific phosphodiesterase class I)